MNVSQQNKTASVAGKGCGTLFFSIFAVMGTFFLVMMGKMALDELRTRWWDATPCTIENIAVVEKGGGESPFTIAVRYRYSVHGHSYTGERLAMNERRFNRASEAAKLADRFPAGAGATCYVNADMPQESVLKREWPTILFMLPLPLIFIAVGVIGVIATWRAKSLRTAESKPISARLVSSSKGGRWGGVIFGGLFFLMGGALCGVMFVRPLVKGLLASGWPHVPCVVTQSGLRTSSGGKGGSQYSLDIRYRYKIGGREYIGDHYNFIAATSNLTGWRNEVVRQYPVGKQTECRVNPDDPREAVLSYELGGDLWFILLPGVFMLAGVGIAIAGWRGKSTKSAVPTATVANVGGSAFTNTASGPMELRPASTPLAKFIGITLAAVIWNGIIWGIFLAGHPPTIVRIFLSFFILIGVFILWGAIAQFLALFNPRPTLRASTGAVPLGGSLQLDWRFTGNVRRIMKLTLTLQAVERATYRRGTDTTTDTNCFVHRQVFESCDAAAIASGQVTIAIPADSIHSIDAPNNKIIWTLQLHGDIARWPDVDLEFPITVLPHAITP